MRNIIAFLLIMLASTNVLSEIEFLVANENERKDLVENTRMSPARQNGQFIGWMVTELKDGSLLSRMGAEVGSIIVSINGHIINDDFELGLFSEILRNESEVVLGLRDSKGTYKVVGVRFIRLEDVELIMPPNHRLHPTALVASAPPAPAEASRYKAIDPH